MANDKLVMLGTKGGAASEHGLVMADFHGAGDFGPSLHH